MRIRRRHPLQSSGSGKVEVYLLVRPPLEEAMGQAERPHAQANSNQRPQARGRRQRLLNNRTVHHRPRTANSTLALHFTSEMYTGATYHSHHQA